MAKAIKADKLRSNIMGLLEGYGEDVGTATEKAIDATAKKTVKQLRNYRPNGAEKYGNWDTYLKGWTAAKDTKSRYTYKTTVHNKKRWQLAHLLEKGHKMSNGKQSKAFVHIQIAEDKAKRWIEEELEKEIEKI